MKVWGLWVVDLDNTVSLVSMWERKEEVDYEREVYATMYPEVSYFVRPHVVESKSLFDEDFEQWVDYRRSGV